MVALTGTDLYRDLPASAEARRSLALADRLVVLQDEARRALPARLRARTRVIYQSADTALRAAPPRGRFRVLVSGHLREEKDPFRAAAALAHLRDLPRLELVQLGAALSEPMKAQAEDWARREPCYRWLGARSHPRALGWIARSHLLVVSSAMEGGANVIAEAARIGTPVLASRIAGNLGMLGRGYPGTFPFGDERALARLIARAAGEPAYYARLKRALRARRPLFAPSARARCARRAAGRAAAGAPRALAAAARNLSVQLRNTLLARSVVHVVAFALGVERRYAPRLPVNLRPGSQALAALHVGRDALALGLFLPALLHPPALEVPFGLAQIDRARGFRAGHRRRGVNVDLSAAAARAGLVRVLRHAVLIDALVDLPERSRSAQRKQYQRKNANRHTSPPTGRAQTAATGTSAANWLSSDHATQPSWVNFTFATAPYLLA